MSTGPLSASLAFSQEDGVIYTSGLINGRVALFGPLSQDMVTIGIGLRLGDGTRHWLKQVETGNVGVFLPGDGHDSLYTPGSLYATVTLTAERLEEGAAKEDLVLDRQTLGGTGVHDRNVPATVLTRLRCRFEQLHSGCFIPYSGGTDISRAMLSATIAHLARHPRIRGGGRRPGRHGNIVEKARAYIVEHLSEPISIDEIAAAACTSRRTLFRAFTDILDETPHTFVRRLRLHRIRHDLAGDLERTCTISLVANQWGIGDLGRMSGWYRALFGERPSDTLVRSRDHPATQ